MGVPNVANFNMLLFKTSSDVSKTKDRYDDSKSFKDIFKKTADSAQNINSKNDFSSKSSVAGNNRILVASSKTQIWKSNIDAQDEKALSQQLPDDLGTDQGTQVQSQTIQAQILELLKMVFNLFQNTNSADNLNLNELLQDISIQGLDFSQSTTQIENIFTQHLDLSDELGNKVSISDLLQSIELQYSNQPTFDFILGNKKGLTSIFESMEKPIYNGESENFYFEVATNINTILQSFKNIFLQQKQQSGILPKDDEGAQIMEKLLKEVENIIAKNSNGISFAISQNDLDSITVEEKGFNNFDSDTATNDNNANKLVGNFIGEKDVTTVNDRKEKSNTEILDLRQHIFGLKNKLENVENSASVQDNGRIKMIRMTIINQLAEKISMIHKQNLTTLQVSIKPEWLGSVVIELSKDSSGKIFGNLIVTSPQVKEIIEGSLSNLLTILKDQGINISQLNVSLGGNNTGQQYQGQQRFSQRRDLFLQSDENNVSSIESLIYEISEGTLNLRA